MQIYRVVALLFEDGPVYLGTFDSLEKANKCRDDALPDFSGPNVDEVLIDEETVQ